MGGGRFRKGQKSYAINRPEYAHLREQLEKENPKLESFLSDSYKSVIQKSITKSGGSGEGPETVPSLPYSGKKQRFQSGKNEFILSDKKKPGSLHRFSTPSFKPAVRKAR